MDCSHSIWCCSLLLDLTAMDGHSGVETPDVLLLGSLGHGSYKKKVRPYAVPPKILERQRQSPFLLFTEDLWF